LKNTAAAAHLRIDPQRMKFLCRRRKISSDGYLLTFYW
jgi:hypothetical protein